MVLALFLPPVVGAAWAQSAPAPQPAQMPPDARFALALYCNPVCGEDVLDALEDSLGSIGVEEGFPDAATRPMRIMGLAGSEFGIPDPDYVADYGVGVDRPEALSGSQQVLLGWFAAPRRESLTIFAQAHAAFARAAALAGGWVEDLDTQTVYGVDAWASRDPRGPLTDWFVVDAVPVSEAEGAPVRVVTRGLRRFGDPELVVPEVSLESAANVSFVLNEVATLLHERPVLDTPLPLASAIVRGNATFSGVEPVEGDPEEPLVRVSFSGKVTPPGEPPPAAPEPAVAPVEAAPPAQIAAVEPPPAASPPLAVPAEPLPPERRTDAVEPRTLQEAQAAALRAFDTRVRAAWEAGLPAGEVIAVQVPFTDTQGRKEYVWAELRTWEGDRLTGVLVNEPYAVPTLKKGDVVEFRRADVFDYIWRRADGSREGNTTAAFLKR